MAAGGSARNQHDGLGKTDASTAIDSRSCSALHVAWSALAAKATSAARRGRQGRVAEGRVAQGEADTCSASEAPNGSVRAAEP